MQADDEQHLEQIWDCPHTNFYSSLARQTSKIFITVKKDCLFSIGRWLTMSAFIFSTKVSSISKEKNHSRLLEPINTYVCGLYIWRNLHISYRVPQVETPCISSKLKLTGWRLVLPSVGFIMNNRGHHFTLQKANWLIQICRQVASLR